MTPFKWMLHLEETLKICNSLLRQSMSRWSIKSKSFRIIEYLVIFNVLDIGVVLGLGVIGKVLIIVYLGWLIICLERRTFQLTRLF